MDDVEAHVARPRLPDDRVQVRAVVVEQGSARVEDLGHFRDVLVEEAERGRVRQHQPRGALVHLRPQVVEVEVAALGRRDLHELVARHRDARRVRPVRGVRGHDRVALVALAPVGEVRPHQHQAGELALRARGRLQGDRRQACDLAQDLLQLPHQLERALGAVVLLVRVEAREPGQPGDELVDPRVVLHRAGAERVEARVDTEVPVGEVREVAHDLVLGELGQAWRLLARECRGNLGYRQAVARDPPRTAPGLALLVDQLHQPHTSASTSARRSMSAGVRFSVSATRSTSSMPS